MIKQVNETLFILETTDHVILNEFSEQAVNLGDGRWAFRLHSPALRAKFTQLAAKYFKGKHHDYNHCNTYRIDRIHLCQTYSCTDSYRRSDYNSSIRPYIITSARGNDRGIVGLCDYSTNHFTIAVSQSVFVGKVMKRKNK